MSWNDWNHGERAVFLNQLNRPHSELDRSIKARDEAWKKKGIDPRAPIPNDLVDPGANLRQGGYSIRADELDALIAAEIDEIQADLEAWEERVAIRTEQYFPIGGKAEDPVANLQQGIEREESPRPKPAFRKIRA